jgi:hypothetical protein
LKCFRFEKRRSASKYPTPYFHVKGKKHGEKLKKNKFLANEGQKKSVVFFLFQQSFQGFFVGPISSSSKKDKAHKFDLPGGAQKIDYRL